MSLSTLTAFDYITENSLATPGLFNHIFSIISDNVGTMNSVAVPPAVLSSSTWAAINLVTNTSRGSDYIRMVDSSGQRSTYRIGSFAGGTADGLNIWDESGNTMIASFSKQSIRFYQNVVGPVFDVGGALSDTLNAATYGTAADSTESRIQAAINAASNQGVSRVYVPASMYPYSASSVSFVYPVQMVREGGNWAVYDIWAYGAAGDNVHDDSAAIDAAINSGSVVYAPAPSVAYRISAVTLTNGKTLLTDGPNTVFQQVPIATYRRVFNITGSNVRMGVCTIQGNISTDTDEQNHAIYINSDTTSIDNIIVEGLIAKNIRGDGVYVGGVGANYVRGVKIGPVRVENVYRHGVTNAGCDDLNIDSIKGTMTTAQVGGYMFDNEPDPGSSPTARVRITSIRGGVVGLLGSSGAAVILKDVKIGTLDLDPSFQINSTPPYSNFTDAIALNTRNLRGLQIDFFKAKNFRDHAWKNVYNLGAGDIYSADVVLNRVDWTNCSTTETVYAAAARIEQVSTTEFSGGTVTHYDTTKQIVIGDASNPDLVQVRMKNIVCGGTVARAVGTSDFDNLQVASTADVNVFVSCQNSTLRNSTISLGRLAGFCKRMLFSNVTANLGTLVFDSGNSNHFLVNSTVNGTYYAQGPWVRSYLNAINFGGYSMWVDVNGNPRVAASPSNDLSGSPIGWQNPPSVTSIAVQSGTVLGPSIRFSSDTSLGFYRSGVSTIAQSFGTFNLATGAVRLSMRTLAASSVTLSAANTNVAQDEVVFTVGGPSGASLCISSGGTTYIFSSALSAKNA